MTDCKFKQLIIDSYQQWSNPENVITRISAALAITKKNFMGIIYGAISSDGFKDIKDIEGYMNLMNPNSLYLKSSLDDSECQVYDYDLVDYKINDGCIWIKTTNNEFIIKTKLI